VPALLHHAANGHLMLELGSVDSALWSALAHHLEDELGFTRTGHVVTGVDEGIRQGFQRDELVLAAGWDPWAGDYLLSYCVAADDLLRALFAGIGPDDTFRANPPVA
jgi:hypothetical protein